MIVTLIKKHIKCTVYTMSKGCFNQINDYIKEFSVKGNSIEETKKNIMSLEYFKNGCFTYIQAQAFAEYFHTN